MNKNRVTLKTLFLVSLISFSILIITIVAITTNVLLKNEFLHYIDVSQEDKVLELKDTLTESLNASNGISKELLVILEQEVMNGFVVQITHKHSMLYDGFMVNSQLIADLSKVYALEEQKTLTHFDSIYAIYQSEIVLNDKNIDVLVYTYRPLFIKNQGFEHLSSLNTVFIYVGLIAIFFAVILGFFLSKILVSPLEKLIVKLNLMEYGKYEAIKESATSIFEYQQIEASFNKLNDSLQMQKTLRKNLSSDLSHELRTPLTAIILTLQNIEEGIWQFDKDTQTSLLAETEKMQILINDIHKLEQVQSQMYVLNIEKVDIVPIIQNILLLYKTVIVDKRIIIHMDFKEKCILADTHRFSQVIMNVVSNSLKYTHDRSEIFIRSYADNDSTIVSIKDTGIGMDKGVQSKVFNRFYRSKDVNVVSQKGSGIGLTVVANIMEAHGGEVLVFSELGSGTEIVLIFKN